MKKIAMLNVKIFVLKLAIVLFAGMALYFAACLPWPENPHPIYIVVFATIGAAASAAWAKYKMDEAEHELFMEEYNRRHVPVRKIDRR